ncbi:MAG: GMC family oxidoreductase N-terminal domain-containing protein [Gammaproteobacteria bacterium]|nr:GMC family oxidoreductase N-terminal domain-containing protein [Gammaproteobacteria bacterium]
MTETGSCDYLVVGGGAAGCIVARRLAERASTKVVLLEAGKTDEGDPLATDLSRLEEQDESYDWGYRARPVAGSEHQILYNRAKMLGGCANHNDCAFLAPPASDFDAWVAAGAQGWDHASNTAAFRRIEERLHIEPSPPGNRLSRAFIDACIEMGLPEVNFRERIVAGTGWFPLNVRGALRQSSSIAYLHPLADLPDNLRVRTETLANRLLIERQRVVGVATDQGSIRASAGVILCAGSINTPQLMMLSGIGDGAELRQLGLPVRVDLPGVGKNLLDHVAANISCELHQPPPAWKLTPCESTAMIRIDADAPAPDVLYHCVLMLRDKYTDVDYFSGIEHGLKLSPNVARPKSRGSLRLASADIRAAPIIDLNYFSDPDGYDQRILTAGLRYARELCASAALSPYIRREVLPGPRINSDEEFLTYIRETCETVYHPSGTCRIGAAQDAMAVVTPDLRVKGVGGLWIADASVFPSMVTVNICNTVMMVAERAVEFI